MNRMIFGFLLAFWVKGLMIEIQTMGWMLYTHKEIQSIFYWKVTHTRKINIWFKSIREKITT